VKNNESVAWAHVMAPLNAQGKFSPKNESVSPGGQVVLATCEHPEAVVKALNLLAEVNIFRNPEYEDVREKYLVPVEGLTDARTNSPFYSQMVQLQNRIIIAENINDYKAAGTLNLDPRVAGDKDYIQGAYDWINNNTLSNWYATKNDAEVDKYMFQYVGHMAHDTVGNLYLEGEKSGLYVEEVPGFVGNVDAQTDYGAMVDDLQNTGFMQIISGEKPLDYFDTYVAEWERLGGTIITDQVNAAIGK
jgi:putative aldouronate transport system substrate-binding protein